MSSPFRDRTRALKRLYAKIPSPNCKGMCTDSCGPIGMTRHEHALIERETGRAVEVVVVNGTTACSMLDAEGKCACYAVRPTICRLWGSTEALPCPYGCKPMRPLTSAQATHILLEAQKIGGGNAEREAARSMKQYADLIGDETLSRMLADHYQGPPTISGRVSLTRRVIDR